MVIASPQERASERNDGVMTIPLGESFDEENEEGYGEDV